MARGARTGAVGSVEAVGATECACGALVADARGTVVPPLAQPLCGAGLLGGTGGVIPHGHGYSHPRRRRAVERGVPTLRFGRANGTQRAEVASRARASAFVVGQAWQTTVAARGTLGGDGVRGSGGAIMAGRARGRAERTFQAVSGTISTGTAAFTPTSAVIFVLAYPANQSWKRAIHNAKLDRKQTTRPKEEGLRRVFFLPRSAVNTTCHHSFSLAAPEPPSLTYSLTHTHPSLFLSLPLHIYLYLPLVLARFLSPSNCYLPRWLGA